MMATCWAGKRDWIITRREQTSPQDKYTFITYILKKAGLRKKHPESWVPKTPLCMRAKEDTQCNCVETVIWHANGSMENLPKEQSTKRRVVEEVYTDQKW